MACVYIVTYMQSTCVQELIMHPILYIPTLDVLINQGLIQNRKNSVSLTMSDMEFFLSNPMTIKNNMSD